MNLRSFLHFMWAAFRNPLQVSTLFQTGPSAARLLTESIPSHLNGVIVELGVGTGAITQAVLAKVQGRNQYLGIELNKDMIEFAEERFPQLRFVNDSAENFAEHLNGQKVVAVVSSLPWSLMPPPIVKKTLDSVYEELQPGGVFATYMTMHVLKTPAGRRFQQQIQEKFEHLESKIVFDNLPPAKIFIARK